MFYLRTSSFTLQLICDGLLVIFIHRKEITYEDSTKILQQERYTSCLYSHLASERLVNLLREITGQPSVMTLHFKHCRISVSVHTQL